MKTIGLMIIGLCLLALTACEKEEPDCRPDTYGVYSGSNGLGGTIEAEVEEGAGDRGVFVVLSNKDANGTTTSSANVKGDLNEDCNTITVPEQQVGSETYSASLSVTESQLSGSITTGQFTFPVALTKQ